MVRTLESLGEKSCEIKGGDQEMAAMMLMLLNFNNGFCVDCSYTKIFIRKNFCTKIKQTTIIPMCNPSLGYLCDLRENSSLL